MQRPHFLRRFRNSMRGIKEVWATEPAFRVRFIGGLCALVLALIVGIPEIELLLLVLSICAMLSAEIANTALEEMCDIVQPNYDVRVGIIKDMLSGTVFVAAIPVFVITCYATLPRLVDLL